MIWISQTGTEFGLSPVTGDSFLPRPQLGAKKPPEQRADPRTEVHRQMKTDQHILAPAAAGNCDVCDSAQHSNLPNALGSVSRLKY